MHAFHNYISTSLKDLLEKRRVVVFYDPRQEFERFVEELPAEDTGEPLPQVSVQDVSAHLARFDGSFFGLREAVESLVSCDLPDPLLIYLPGVERDRQGSVLMELEKAGTHYEPQLKRLARNVLRETHSDGQIDAFLSSDTVTYNDIVGLLRQHEEAEATSLLRTLYEGKKSLDLLAQWLATEDDDARIHAKKASGELYQLIETRLGLPIPAGVMLAATRDAVTRYVLLNEFRLDLQTTPPPSISLIQVPPTATHRDRIRELAGLLRSQHPTYYQQAANQIEADFNLPGTGLKAENLGTIDTFCFEAEVILRHASTLVADGSYEKALEIVETHRRSYWVERDVARQAQWEACRLTAELGAEVERVGAAVQKANGGPAKWVAAYADENGWHRVDGAHRALEAWVASMDQEPLVEQALGKVRRAYEMLLHTLSERFTKALCDAGWTVEDALGQAQVYPDIVKPGPGRTAYFLVDALRYEMGAALARQMEGAKDLVIQPAVAALPTVTPVGMAALLPEASGSFSVVEHRDKLAARIEDVPMPGLNERLKLFKSKVPDLVNLTLDEVLQKRKGDLKRKVGDSSLVLVRSQEIDLLGEQGMDHLARQVMGTVIGNVVRAVRKLAGLGIERFVITADHGHQFGLRKEKDMHIDAPGGHTVKLTRRCWVGHGGSTPPGTVRVQGAELGYDTTLDFIFPLGIGVFKSGGGLSYHHGGASLQELVVPVLSFRMESGEETQAVGREIELVNIPETITNRTFPVSIRMPADLFATEAVPLRVILLSGGEQVGEARMAMNAEIDRSTGWVLMQPGTEAMVGLILTRDIESLRIVVQDPQSGRVYKQTDEIPVKLSI